MSTEDAPAPLAVAVAGDTRVLVVRAPYYADVVNGMSAGAFAILGEAGARHEVLDVSGAFELAAAIGMAARGRAGFDGYVALGCIVRGGTDHYDYICRESLAGLMRVALDHGLALGTGVLTVHSIEQARVRADAEWRERGGHNKGAEAAAACLRQIAVARAYGDSR